MKYITTFPDKNEFKKAAERCKSLSIQFDVANPFHAFSRVAVPSLVLNGKDLGAFNRETDITSAGWVEHRPARLKEFNDITTEYPEDRFGRLSIMLLAPCMGDTTKIRLVAHISGNMAEVFPYMNSVLPTASYNPNAPVFSFMDGYTMIALYPQRITVAKADEIVHAWQILENIRRLVNGAWEKREEIEPSYETRSRPPALEILKRLPKTNCKECGKDTCTAFSVSVYEGELPVSSCKPVFEGEFGEMKEALIEICAGMGLQNA